MSVPSLIKIPHVYQFEITEIRKIILTFEDLEMDL